MIRSALAFVLIATTGLVNAGTTIAVGDAWSRPATRTAVVYAVFANRGPRADRLTRASSPVATRVELHESLETKMPAMSSSTSTDKMPMSGSMMSMRSLSAIPIPAHGTTTLAPGGYHLMLDLRRKIAPGETIPLRLHFARAGWILTSIQVRPIR